MARDPEQSYDFISRLFRSFKIATAAIVGAVGTLITVAALDFQINDRWSTLSVPLWLMLLILIACVLPLAVIAIVLLMLLNDAMRSTSFYRSKASSLASTLAGAQELAYTDPITGIPNSNGLRGELERTSSAARRCLILIDLRDFRSINKRHNHWLGDEYLRAFADMVFHKSRRDEYLYKRRTPVELNSDREQDAKGFRKASGSDEFFMLLEGDLFDGLGFLNRLQARRNEFEDMSVRILGEVHTFGFTAGVIELAPGEPFDSAVERVSICLQKASDPAGPSDVYWPPDLARTASESSKRIVETAHRNFARTTTA